MGSFRGCRLQMCVEFRKRVKILSDKNYIHEKIEDLLLNEFLRLGTLFNQQVSI